MPKKKIQHYWKLCKFDYWSSRVICCCENFYQVNFSLPFVSKICDFNYCKELRNASEKNRTKRSRIPENQNYEQIYHIYMPLALLAFADNRLQILILCFISKYLLFHSKEKQKFLAIFYLIHSNVKLLCMKYVSLMFLCFHWKAPFVTQLISVSLDKLIFFFLCLRNWSHFVLESLNSILTFQWNVFFTNKIKSLKKKFCNCVSQSFQA